MSIKSPLANVPKWRTFSAAWEICERGRERKKKERKRRERTRERGRREREKERERTRERERSKRAKLETVLLGRLLYIDVYRTAKILGEDSLKTVLDQANDTGVGDFTTGMLAREYCLQGLTTSALKVRMLSQKLRPKGKCLTPPWVAVARVQNLWHCAPWHTMTHSVNLWGLLACN